MRAGVRGGRGEARNASDGLFDAALLMDLSGPASRQQGRFDFVLDLP